jgi:hypothetical protein
VYKVTASAGQEIAMKVSYKSHCDLREEAACLAIIQEKSTINSQFVVQPVDVFQLGRQQAFTMEFLPISLMHAIEQDLLNDEQPR